MQLNLPASEAALTNMQDQDHFLQQHDPKFKSHTSTCLLGEFAGETKELAICFLQRCTVTNLPTTLHDIVHHAHKLPCTQKLGFHGMSLDATEGLQR